MSHTIGQVKQNNPQLNEKVSQDSQQPEQTVSNHGSLLTEGDYEFLFNQLLEGIAHGWHDQRIVKFFNQLGDRGKQEDWIAWLERLRIKVLTLPTQSKRQLGTMMIRLGELTQSARQVSEIGSTSNRIGRELLFGNTKDVLWEYAGPDSIEDRSEVETEDELSKRLPKDFSELSSSATEEELISPLENSTIPENLTVADSSEDQNSPSPNSVDSLVSELGNLEDNTEEGLAVEKKEFEAELDSKPINQDEKSSQEILENTLSIFDNPIESQLESKNSQTVDVEQLMSLIQDDQELAQQISQKLNISLSNLVVNSNQSIVSEDSASSSLELIESWFNLGLKQVSAGEFAKAIISWDKALKINPNLSEAWHNRGSALGRLGDRKSVV